MPQLTEPKAANDHYQTTENRRRAMDWAQCLNPCTTPDRSGGLNPDVDKLIADADKIYAWFIKEV